MSAWGRATRGMMLAAGLTALAGTHAVGEEAPPAGCHWQSIPDLKVTLVVPDDWIFEKVPGDGPATYEIRPAGDAFPTPPSSRYRLVVERGHDPGTVVEMARKHVDAARSEGAPTAEMERQSQGAVTVFVSVVSLIDAGTGESTGLVAVSALANAATGTLYKTRFDIPSAELQAVGPLASQIFQAIQIDDEI